MCSCLSRENVRSGWNPFQSHDCNGRHDGWKVRNPKGKDAKCTVPSFSCKNTICKSNELTPNTWSFKRVGTLYFDFNAGSCTAGQFGKEENIFACFPAGNSQACWQVWNENGTWHNQLSSGALGNHSEGLIDFWNGKPLAIGGQETTIVESYNFTLDYGTWKVDEKPFPGGNLRAASSAQFMGDIFIFGGIQKENVAGIVWKYSGKWKNIGSLKHARYGHSSIVCQNTILVGGGYGKL